MELDALEAGDVVIDHAALVGRADLGADGGLSTLKGAVEDLVFEGFAAAAGVFAAAAKVLFGERKKVALKEKKYLEGGPVGPIQ